VLLKVKVVLFAEAQLQQIVIKRFLAHVYLLGCVLEGVSDELLVAQNTIVQTSPKTNFLNDIFDRSLFGSLSFDFDLDLIGRRVFSSLCFYGHGLSL